MTVNLSALAGAGAQFFDANGTPLSGGKLYSYAAGTTTPQATYTDFLGSAPHTNPIILNAAGRVATGEIWVTAGINYKFVLYSSDNVLIASWDNITGINGSGIATNANYVSYTAPFPLTVASNVQTKLSQFVHVKDFGAVGDGVTDDTVSIQNALNSGASTVYISDGTYFISPSGVVWPPGVVIQGDGTLIRSGATSEACLRAVSPGTYRISGITFNDGGTSQQNGMLEVNNPSAEFFCSSITAHNGYAGIWVKQANIVDIDGGNYYNCSHNLYLGQNDAADLPGTLNNVTLRGVVSHNARVAGDGLKTVSTVNKLVVVGGRFYSNSADGIDLFAGADEVTLIGVESYDNGFNGIDIKIGILADYPYAKWGNRRRVQIIGGFFNNNTLVGIRVYGEPSEGWYQNVLIDGVNIIGNGNYGIECRAIGARIVNNLLIGNGVSTAANYAALYMIGDGTYKPSGGVVANNVILNNGVAGRVNTGITVNTYTDLVISGNVIGNYSEIIEPSETDWGISVSASEKIQIYNNIFKNLVTFKMVLSAANCILGYNEGIVLKNSGTATILSGTTSVTINHGCAARPDVSQVRLYPAGPLFGSSPPYPGVTSDTQITASVSTAPSSDMQIYWEVDLTNTVNPYAITN